MTTSTTPVPTSGARGSRCALLILGVLVPLLCLTLDPCILRADGWCGEPLVRVLFVRASVVAGFGTTALGIVFALAQSPTARPRALCIGVLEAGIGMAALMQLAMLPFVVVGLLFFGFGVLGLAPLLTLYACRQLRRERLSAPARVAWSWRLIGGATAVAVALGIAVAVTLRAPIALRALVHAPTVALQREVATYQWLFELADVANEIEGSLDREPAAAFATQRARVGIPPLYKH